MSESDLPVAIIAISCAIALIVCILVVKWFMQGGKYKKNTTVHGKVVIVTGANSGIGLETTLELAKRGATVYMACRDMKKAEKVRKAIIAEVGNERIYVLKLDLASLASIREFVDNFKKAEDRLDILINNAGVMGCPRMLTKDGFEMQLGVNHMGHFLLTNLLLDLLKNSAPSRIVVVSSMAHKWGEINKADLNSEKSYKRHTAYYQSKLANVLFTRELAKRLEGSNVTVNALHPGVVETNITRFIILGSIVKVAMVPFTKTTENGAQTTVYAALDPDLETVTGKYFSDCKLADVSKAAKDDAMAKWLWEESVKWTMLET